MERTPFDSRQAGIPTAPPAGLTDLPRAVPQAGIPTAPGGAPQAGIVTGAGGPPSPDPERERARARARAHGGGDPLLSAVLDGSRSLGRYRVLKMLGRGGMGTVFEAHDEQLDRKVAIKLLHADVAERHEQRLRQEARALAQLAHPNVVQIYGTGEVEGRLFIAMELVEGQTLARWHEQPRPWPECVDVYVQAGRGLAAAHDKGLVHRDFNPNNCIIDEAGRVRVLDFGLAVGLPTASEPSTDDPQRPRLTQTGAVLGTLAYMAFERLQGKAADAKSDQFSACVSLHEALYGQRPFEGEGAYELILALEHGRVRPPPAGSTVPASLRRVLLRGLSRDPADRWPSMDALIEALVRVGRPRSRRWWVAVGAGVVAIGGLSWSLWPAGSPPCEGAQERLAGIWDDDVRARAEQAVLGTGVAYAADTWERLGPVLDDYAAVWAQQHHDACAATRLRGEQTEADLDERMRCLDDGLRELQALSEMLVTADAGTVRSAGGSSGTLPSVERCADLEHVRAQQPLPEEPAQRRALHALDARLARARALFDAGRRVEALALVEELDAEATAQGHAPLVVDVGLLLGTARGEQGDYDESIEVLERTYFEAKRWQLNASAVKAASRIIYTYGLRQSRFDEAVRWAKHAEADAELLEDPVIEAHLHLTLGILHAVQGAYEVAAPHMDQALAQMEHAKGPRHPMVAGVLTNLGNFHHQTGNIDLALEELRRALSIEEEVLGPNHPQLAGTLSNLGVILYARRELEPAHAAFVRAVAIGEQGGGGGTPAIARDLDFLANAELDLGRLPEAKEHCSRGLAMREQLLGPDHNEITASLKTLGRIHAQEGDHAQALEEFERASRILREALGPSHPFMADLLDHIGQQQLELGRHEDAVASEREALAILTEAFGPSHPNLVLPLRVLGQALVRVGEPAEARELLLRAEAIQASIEVVPEERAQVQLGLAQAELELGEDRARAIARARTAREAFGSGTHRDAKELAVIDAWLRAAASGSE